MILAALLLELTVLNKIKLFRVQPDLLLICVVFFSMVFSRNMALEAGLIAGVFRDFTSSEFFGLNILLFGLTAVIINFYNNKIYKEFFLAQMLLMAIAGLFFYIGHLFFRIIFSSAEFNSVGAVFTCVIIPSVLYTAIVSPLVFFVLSKIIKKIKV